MDVPALFNFNLIPTFSCEEKGGVFPLLLGEGEGEVAGLTPAP